MALVEHRIGAICCHTNLDAVQGGVNDVLAQRAGLTEIGQLHQAGTDANGAPYGIGRVGTLIGGPIPLKDYLVQLKTALQPNGLRFCDAGRPVSRVAVGGGACADMLTDALAAGCDTFVTSDVRYNGFLDAKDWGINLIDAGHFPTEDVICPYLVDFLTNSFADLEVKKSQCHHEVISYA
jgi:putative NIF3 family GTP cyclohydrolase 1 type 2